jgi:aspartate/tyrosine/aromatic aminotransferase
MFETVTTAPPDPILGITDAFNADANPLKINLSVGVYQDASGKTTIPPSVKEAEQRILAAETSKGYKPISGDPAYGKAVRQMLFGIDHDLVASGRAVTAHTPGGTGALRVAGDFYRKVKPDATVWLSDPTWPNHAAIFQSAGLKTATYPYFDPAANALAFPALIDALKKIPAGDIALLHGGCHNPTGADPTVDQWRTIANVLAERGVIPLIDFAYQGFATGIDDDAAGVRALAAICPELFICSSFSKNFGLYNERTGAMTLVARTADHAAAAMSQIRVVIRSNYSNPPAHGGEIVKTVLADADLRRRWELDVAQMRDRINGMRNLFVDSLKARGVQQNFDFIRHQRGMFSFSGLTKQQVEALRAQFAIYIVGSGRINVAGMTTANMDRLCDAIKAVL